MSRQRIIDGKVPAKVQELFDLGEVEIWQALTNGQRQDIYDGVKSDHARALWDENMNRKLGQGVLQGKNAILIEAIETAYRNDPETKAAANARRAAEELARQREVVDCKRCEFGHTRRDSLQVGDTVVGFLCMTQAEKDFIGLK